MFNLLPEASSGIYVSKHHSRQYICTGLFKFILGHVGMFVPHCIDQYLVLVPQTLDVITCQLPLPT
ncbi:MAG: hypothetical protein IPJ13_21095 [Saprospiraceae bacterium]|nr:hypothetical protein [Saprospiraceae bacterium]